MSSRALYFRTLHRISVALSSFSGEQCAETFQRLHALFALLELKTAGGAEPTIDPAQSGFPILKEVISVANDSEHGVPGGVGDPDTLRAAMLEEMLGPRRLPDDRAIAGVAKALYAKALEDLAPKMLRPDAEQSFYAVNHNQGDLIHVSWDAWDGRTNRAIRCYANFAFSDRRILQDKVMQGDILNEVRRIANAFTASYTPISLASEIDDKVHAVRLKELTKVTVGPFLSPIFSKIDDPLSTSIAAEDDLEDAWAMRWTVDKVVSSGTVTVGAGVFAKGRPQERFVLNSLDPDCVERGVSEFAHHVAMPHDVFQHVADGPNAEAVSKSLVHVLTPSGRLIENA